jgi:hypothetical protein
MMGQRIAARGVGVQREKGTSGDRTGGGLHGKGGREDGEREREEGREGLLPRAMEKEVAVVTRR